MKKLAFLAMILFLSGCTFSNSPAFWADKKMKIELPLEMGTRTATSCSIHLLGFIGSFGDNSLGLTALRAGIKNITYYEHKYKYYIFWGESCNTAFGY